MVITQNVEPFNKQKMSDTIQAEWVHMNCVQYPAEMMAWSLAYTKMVLDQIKHWTRAYMKLNERDDVTVKHAYEFDCLVQALDNMPPFIALQKVSRIFFNFY